MQRELDHDPAGGIAGIDSMLDHDGGNRVDGGQQFIRLAVHIQDHSLGASQRISDKIEGSHGHRPSHGREAFSHRFLVEAGEFFLATSPSLYRHR